MQAINISADQLRGYANDGMCPQQISNITGNSRGAIKRAARRLSVDLPHGHRRRTAADRIDHLVADLSPLEAVEELKAIVLELIAGNPDDGLLDSFELPHLTPQQETILRFLFRNAGRTVTRDQMVTALYFDKPEPDGASKVIDVRIHQIRKLTAGIFDIQSVRAKGYRLKVL